MGMGMDGTERQGHQRLVALGDQERPTPAGTAQSPAAGLTSATQIGTGEWDAMRRASFTSEAVPGPPGKATTSTEASEPGEVWATALAMACSSSSRLRIGPAARPCRSHWAGITAEDQPSCWAARPMAASAPRAPPCRSKCTSRPPLRASSSAATRCWDQAKSRPPPAAITKERDGATAGPQGIQRSMNQLPDVTTDRGNTPQIKERQCWRDQGIGLPQAMGSGPLAQPLF